MATPLFVTAGKKWTAIAFGKAATGRRIWAIGNTTSGTLDPVNYATALAHIHQVDNFYPHLEGLIPI